MINIKMWPALKPGQSIYYVQYDDRKRHWAVVARLISTLKKTLEDKTYEDGRYKYLVGIRGKGESPGIEFYLPEEDFFFAEEDAENAAIMYNLRSKMNDMCRISDQVKEE